jgi:S-adenosylmethionine:tRNA ribosyltransferase-isomerase
MHSEWVEVDKKTANIIMQAKKDGRRVIAVGTTTARALEGVAEKFPISNFQFPIYEGDVNIFITPGFEFKVIDGLITNFHLPKSTLLMLVSAFACPSERRGGREKVLRAYRLAVKKNYRFFSFGDAMLII